MPSQASIGFSIPISKMFSGAVVWRGVIYTVLMLLGKALCGLWLVRFSLDPLRDAFAGFCDATASRLRTVIRWLPLPGHKEEQPATTTATTTTAAQGQPVPPQEPLRLSPTETENTKKKPPGKPLSLYPAGIMSFAMIARGEIGFLISSVAEANGIFRGSSSSSSDEASELFLIVTWAIVLCTIVGPLCVGLLVRRVKKLEAAPAGAQVEGGRRNVLGVWGVS